MKIKNVVLFFLAICASFLPIISSVNNIATQENDENNVAEKLNSQTPSEISTVNIKSLLYPNTKDNETGTDDIYYLEKIQTFNTSFGQFVQEEFNSPDYADHLTQNAMHFVELIKIIDEMNLGKDAITYFYTIFKLFNDKFKECEFIDHTVVIHTLRETTPILGKYITYQENLSNFDSIKKQLQNMLQFKLTEHLNKLTTPTEPTDNLVFDLTQIFMNFEKTSKDSLENVCKLRSIIVGFFENILGKTLWSKTFYESNWISFKTIGHLINRLYKYKVLDDEDELDRIKWSLVHRFNYFLNVLGIAFPLEFYAEIEEDIANKSVPFFEEEEQDDFIKTKKETFLSYISNAKTKVIAYEKAGIIS